jgi:Ca2+-binding EF-hand superfamily protein
MIDSTPLDRRNIMLKNLVGLMVVGLLVTPQLFAADEGNGAEHPLQALVQKLKAADKDGDGRLSKEEAPGPLKENFAKIDANGDGYIDKQELQEQFGKQFAVQAILTQLKKADQDGDGKLSKDEAPQFLKGHFDQVDANSDGYVDGPEVKAALTKLQKLLEATQQWLTKLKESDTNNDSKLSKDEAPEPLKQHFEKVDADGDGFLDTQEIKEAVGQYLKHVLAGEAPGK